MRTVTLEFRTDDLARLGVIPERFFTRYEEVELLETLRLERGWRLQLLRLRRRGALKSAEELEKESRRIRRLYGLERMELVERRPRTRDYILLVRQRNPDWLRRLLTISGGQISPTTPFRLTPDHVIATFHGEEGALRRVLGRLHREEFPFRIVRASTQPYLGDAGAAPLTDRQRSVLARAWALGFYSVPRKITLTRLARLTGQSPPALGKMLRRAEGHLVTQFLAAGASDEAVAETAASADGARGRNARVAVPAGET